MADTEVTFSAGTMDKGIQVNTSDFQPTLTLDFDSFNVTQGIYQGLGPRYGMAPIPGHQGTEALVGTGMPTMQKAEGANGVGFSSRHRVLGVYAMTVPNSAVVGSNLVTYAFILDTTKDVTPNSLDISLTAVNQSAAIENPTNDIRNGFGVPAVSSAGITNEGFPYEAITYDENASKSTAVRALLALGDSSKYYCQSAFAVCSSGNIGLKWIIGRTTAIGDATHAPNIAYTGQLTDGAVKVSVPCVPFEYQLQNFTKSQRAIKIFTFGSSFSYNIQYSVALFPSTSIFFSDVTYDAGTPNLLLSGTTAVKDSAGITYANNIFALVNDDQCISNASYKIILIAQNKAIACLFQDGARQPFSGKYNQWVDLTQINFCPPIVSSIYSEDGILTKTGMYAFPNFVTGTPLAATNVSLTAANTGVLRANTPYEFTYSLYNKRINYESNVAKPVKFYTGTDEFVALNLFTPSGANVSLFKDYEYNAANPVVPFVFGTQIDAIGYQQAALPINFYEYRFYYRQQGTASWLPALTIDAAKFWFYPGWAVGAGIWACSGPIAGSVGGEPGAFNDYSQLPQDLWTSTVVYKNRAFWFSKNQGTFSLRNNFLSYPRRNSFASASGEFRGALVHNYPGQAEQSSRLVIFGTTNIYVGRFTGSLAQMNVQVSADNSGIFDVDGSDFVCDPWTSITAFSYRAAAIGDGVLYYWGQQGIYVDNGVNVPNKLSIKLEPSIFTLYDPNKIDEIHAHYNSHTKEVMWFYPPKTADGYATHCLVYSPKTGEFLRFKFTSKIDWLQDLNIETSLKTSGLRAIAGIRQTASTTVQRAYYFDEVNRSGDMYPKGDFVVKTVSTPSSGLRRLTLASGFDATFLAAVSIGDTIALQQTVNYATSMTAVDDMLAIVAAKNSGAGTIDITLPTGATMDASFSSSVPGLFFPIWHQAAAAAGLNGITWQIKTAYWMPEGSEGYFYWVYLYLLAKLTLWKSNSALSVGLGYRSPTATAMSSDSFSMTANSDGNAQVFKRLSTGADNIEGQALRYLFSGIHIGHEWLLQYLQTRNQRISADVLYQFMS